MLEIVQQEVLRLGVEVEGAPSALEVAQEEEDYQYPYPPRDGLIAVMRGEAPLEGVAEVGDDCIQEDKMLK